MDYENKTEFVENLQDYKENSTNARDMPASRENNEEINLGDMIRQVKKVVSYLRRQWIKIFIAAMLGGAIGFFYASLQPVKYSARLTFVLEETKSSPGGLASLAGQFGLDIGGGGGGGIFTGENVLAFLKSQTLVRETLLSQYDKEPKTLADQYAAVYNLQEQWGKDKKVGSVVFFKKEGEPNRLEDSLLQGITNKIINEELVVGRPDKKASFIEVKAIMRDEMLSKLFCDRLVALALEKYIASKVKVKDANVRILQRRADSLEAILNARTYNAASSQQALLDINPGLRSVTAVPEIKSREKMTVAAIYTEVVKNLELAKTILNQETPTIEIVDQSRFPLQKEKTSRLISMISVGCLFAFLVTIILLVGRWWRANV